MQNLCNNLILATQLCQPKILVGLKCKSLLKKSSQELVFIVLINLVKFIWRIKVSSTLLVKNLLFIYQKYFVEMFFTISSEKFGIIGNFEKHDGLKKLLTPQKRWLQFTLIPKLMKPFHVVSRTESSFH